MARRILSRPSSGDTPGSSLGQSYVLRATTASGTAAEEDILSSASGAQTGTFTLGAPTDWWDPSSFTQGLAAMQWCGLWAMPGI